MSVVFLLLLVPAISMQGKLLGVCEPSEKGIIEGCLPDGCNSDDGSLNMTESVIRRLLRCLVSMNMIGLLIFAPQHRN